MQTLAKASLVSFIGVLLFSTSVFAQKRPRDRTFKAFVLTPPELILPGVERIAILDFDVTHSADSTSGHYGRSLANNIIDLLLEEQRGIHDVSQGGIFSRDEEGVSFQGGTTRAYGIVERSRLSEIMGELALGEGDAFDNSNVVDLGRLTGAQALLTGTLNYTTGVKLLNEQRSEKRNGERVRWTVKCAQREVHIRLTARVLDTQTGEILGSTQADKENSDKHCEDSRGSLRTADELIEGAIGSLSRQVANYIAPVFELREFEIKKSDRDKPYWQQAQQAADFADKLEIDRAYTLFAELRESNPYDPNLLENLGVLQEAVGNYKEALELFEMAYSMTEEKYLQSAIERTEKGVEFSDALAAIGVELPHYDFEVEEEVLAEKVRTAQAAKVWAAPQEGTDLVTEVPAGILLPVLAHEGNWYRVRLIDGKEGFLHSQHIQDR